MTAGVSSSAQNVGTPTTVETGWARNSNSVTTPKFPPPPRIAQKSSGFSSALAVARSPSASTRSAESRLSIVSPQLRVRCPRPPPRVNPPTPVVEITPDGTASPCSCVTASTRPHVQPPPTRTVRLSGSTVTASSRDRSATTPSSTLPSPPPLWPPPRTASGRSWLVRSRSRPRHRHHRNSGRSTPAVGRSSRCRAPSTPRRWRPAARSAHRRTSRRSRCALCWQRKHSCSYSSS